MCLVQTARVNFRSSAARRALPVPPSTVYFWIIKALSTATDESTSDYRVHAVRPSAVGLDFIGFLAALAVRFRMRRYQAWTYWFAVIVAGVFAKVVADVLHVGFGVPHVVSTILASSAVAAVFLAWRRTEHTLSIHSVDDPILPEPFYWAAVGATFALGTAVGALTATTLNSISFADRMGKATKVGGLSWGDGQVALALRGLIIGLVAYPFATRVEVPAGPVKWPTAGWCTSSVYQ